MAQGTTVGGGHLTVSLSHSAEQGALLARQLAGAINAHIASNGQAFLGGSSLETLQAALGNETLTGSLGSSAVSVTGGLSKALADFAKTGLSSSSLLPDFTKAPAAPAVTLEEPKAAGTASTITLSDATKITFQGISELNTKNFN